MSGRYAFSLPEPRERDGWFRVGQVDVTTTVLITALGVVSMFLYAVNPSWLFQGVFIPELVRNGEVWRLIAWPLVNPPIDIWMVLGLLVFWYTGRFVEDEMGRIPYTVLIVAVTVLPAIVVTAINAGNATDIAGATRWTTATFSVDLLGIALITIFTLSNPSARFFFGIPGWVMAAVFIGIRVLSAVGVRAWGTLAMLLLVLVVALFGARQRGLVETLDFIPRFRRLAGSPSPYGQVRETRRDGGRRIGRGRGRGRTKPPKGGGSVVSGPWQGSMPSSPPQASGLTPLEQAELDSLLDIIGERGIDGLSPYERGRLNELSQRLRGG